eukprot:TRINITY_DN303_c0_g2_i1.p1 TRINITY_DN303_c0_g2~~TRINITY_DN303_c0_g2_i1.p1  ORF type:complete len:569 (+),score=129.13 TRINITY_DN303_c0_g2_i1:1385-3091(+)
MPGVQDFRKFVTGAQYFSCIDFKSAFYQIPLSEEAKDYLGIIGPDGTYVPQFLDFEPKNAPAASSKMLNELLDHEAFRKNAMGRIDDILVATKTLEEHLRILELLFSRMKERRMSMNVEKTELLAKQVTYMGFVVDQEGISLKDNTIEKIRNASLPTSLSELKSFNGLLEWGREFSFDGQFSTDMGILANALKRKKVFYLLDEEKEAFKRLTKTHFGKLVHPDFGKPFILTTDASDIALSSILSQEHGIIGYGGRKFRQAERKKAIPEKELLAIVHSICVTWKDYLTGIPFKLRCDARALRYLHEIKLENAKLFRWSIRLSPFTFLVEHIEGKSNPADYGSRYIDYDDEEEDQQFVQRKQETYGIKEKFLRRENDEIFVKLKREEYRLPTLDEKEELLRKHWDHHLSPETWFAEIHERGKIYWPKMFEEYRRTCEGCVSCQAMKPFPKGNKYWQNLPMFGTQVQLDHLGPFRDQDGVKFWILTTVERFSGRLTAHVVTSTGTEDTLVILHQHVFPLIIPTHIHGDNAFRNSEEFVKFCDLYGIKVQQELLQKHKEALKLGTGLFRICC